MTLSPTIKEYWSREAGTMNRVYARSSLNLAATFGKGGQSGLFSCRNPAADLPCIARSLDFNTDDFLIHDTFLWTDEVGNSALAQ